MTLFHRLFPSFAKRNKGVTNGYSKKEDRTQNIENGCKAQETKVKTALQVGSEDIKARYKIQIEAEYAARGRKGSRFD